MFRLQLSFTNAGIKRIIQQDITAYHTPESTSGFAALSPYYAVMYADHLMIKYSNSQQEAVREDCNYVIVGVVLHMSSG